MLSCNIGNSLIKRQSERYIIIIIIIIIILILKYIHTYISKFLSNYFRKNISYLCELFTLLFLLCTVLLLIIITFSLFVIAYILHIKFPAIQETGFMKRKSVSRFRNFSSIE